MAKTVEDIKVLKDDELKAALDAATARRSEIAALADDELTDELLDELESSNAFIVSARSEQAERDESTQARADRIAAARAAADEETEDEAADEATENEDEEEVEIPDDASELIEETAVVASAKKSMVAKVAKKAPAVVIHTDDEEAEEAPRATIVAAANVPEVSAGSEFPDLNAVASAFANRARSFGGSPKKALGKARGIQAKSTKGENVFVLSDNASRFGLARVNKADAEFETGSDRPIGEQIETIMAAAKENRLSGGSLVAAGGWAAPSETIYSQYFLDLETVSGILSIPEVHINRGGINFTKGPDYAELAADWGFLQTEAQAEAGTTKECYSIESPDFEEVRLDAIGFCITSGVLTNVGYPELVRRVLQIGLVAHAHKVNAQVISRISNYIGAATNFTEVGSVAADVLDAANLGAVRLRYLYALAVNATIEAVFPLWSKELFRGDLSRRTGVPWIAVTDADINQFFAVRNIAVQWVYDYEPFATGNTSAFTTWPTTLEFLMYPAGAFIKGTSPVLDLDTIYDSVGLSTNTYTAAFFEEGLLVANTGASGVKYSVAVAGLTGITGAANIGNAD